LTENVPLAIAHITKEASETDSSLSEDFSIELFDEEPVINETSTIDLFIPDALLNPLQAAHDFIRANEDDALSLLGSIADKLSNHGEEHSMILQEIALAMNTIEGDPIDPKVLWAGITLHDIGLAQLSDILSANRRLTKEEVMQVQLHPIIGGEVADRLIGGSEFKPIIVEHHERVDGRGYPYGLKGEHISEGGKILAIVDSFHSMIVSRPYKKYTKNLLRAVTEINACVGTHYDERWVTVFNFCIKEYWLPAKKNMISQAGMQPCMDAKSSWSNPCPYKIEMDTAQSFTPREFRGRVSY